MTRTNTNHVSPITNHVGNETRENTMFGNHKSALFVTAAALFALIALFIAPQAAFAANECGDPAANGTAADTFVCPVDTYSTGIQHTSAGDLTVEVQTGSDFGTGGVVSTAGGASDDLTLRLKGPPSTAVSHNFNTAFPVLLDAESQSSDILVDLAVERTNTSSPPGIAADNTATRRLVRAISTGGGDVTVTSSTFGRDRARRGGFFSARGAADAAAIEARSIGGDVTIDLDPGNGDGSANGRLYGILAEVTGAGNLTITGRGTANTSTAGSAGIHATAATGTITIVSGGQGSSGQTGVFIDSGGDVEFTGSASGTEYGIDLADVAAGTTSTLNLMSISGGVAAVRAAGVGEVMVNVRQSISTLNFDFTGMSERVEVGVNGGGAWRPPTGASSTVTAGNFSIGIGSDGALIAGVQAGSGGSANTTLEAPVVVTFNDPTTVLTNAGFIVVGPDNTSTSWQSARHEAELQLVGLGEFRHSGTIMLGGCGFPCGGSNLLGGIAIQGAIVNITDSWYDDLFVFENGGWIGEGGKIVFDVDTGRTQADCEREEVTFNFGAADCVRIVDSTVEGVTYVNVNEILAGDRGRLTQEIMDVGILLIDAPGSTVTAENFALDPTLRSYNPLTGSLDKGLFQYVFLFDEDASQFRLLGALTGAAHQLPMAATAAHNLWRVSTGSWLNRQADLRDGLQEGLGGGVWLRASSEEADRDLTNVSTLGGLPFSTDNSHRQDTYAITGGLDLLSSSDGNTGYVVGLMAGYGHTDLEYEASPNTQAMDAWSYGVYAGLVHGGLFVDAVVNANSAVIDTDAPGFNFFPKGTILSSRLTSVGSQVEAGWRLPFQGGFFVEPLAGVSYVRSKMGDLQIKPDDGSRPGLVVSFEDPSSFRAGVGARFGLDRDFGGLRTQLSFLARTWNDLEGKNTAVIHNLAFPDDPDIRVVDDFSGTFNELTAGASVWSPGGTVSGFLNLGGKFGDDYEATSVSAGVRVHW
jgi:hypothetical protein